MHHQYENQKDKRIATKTSLLGRLWRGEIGLAKTFWLYGVIGVPVVGFVSLIALFASSHYVHGDLDAQVTARAMLTASAIVWIYIAFVAVAVWRAAGRTHPLSWPALAARAICFAPLLLFLALIYSTTRDEKVYEEPVSFSSPQQRPPSFAEEFEPVELVEEPSVTTVEDEHFERIYAAHPDADAIADDPVFIRWVAVHPERKRIVEKGTADEVIALVSAYKAARRTKWVHTPVPVPMAPAAVPDPYPNCVIYPVMTDADYAACGITPPGQ